MNDATIPERSSDPGLFGAEPEGAAYRVLARKYRPGTFDDLIGQGAMVRTVSNAFETGRIPQAWILTGVRGVGKTTTARILARALNYQLEDGSVQGPTIKMPKLGVHCQAIMESRHIDVLEMDAASHNGVDDVRALTDASRYAPVSARYKVYILDEVHMLSTPAFNALLKTLEEPPAHVKFIFATTEIRKVPVTVLSRCQRFDLRRIDNAVLVKHLEGISAKEKLETETEALALIARAAEGSVRDALSLFDQAIAHAAGSVRANDVREMLGLADRTRVIDLFEALMKGDIGRALDELRNQYDSGADPSIMLSDLAEFTHFVTRVKIVPAVADDISLSESERSRGRALATALSMRVLSRTWQMLLKGIAEVKDAARPVAAAEMVLVRIAYVADLDTPDETIRKIKEKMKSSSDNGSCHIVRAAIIPTTILRVPTLCAGVVRLCAQCGDGAARWAARGARAIGAARGRFGARRGDRASDRHIRGNRRLGGGEARPADEIRAGARRAAGALRGRQARTRAGIGRRQDAGERAVAQAQAVDRPELDGGGVRRCRRPHAQVSGRRETGSARNWRARRSAGEGGAGALARLADHGGAQRQGRPAGNRSGGRRAAGGRRRRARRELGS